MIKELTDSIQKQPVRWLAAGVGMIAVAVVARKLTDSPDGREKLVNELQGGYDRVRETGSNLWHDGTDKAQALKKEAYSLKASMGPISEPLEKNGSKSGMSNHESAVAAFMATLVTKGVASYFQWRSAEKARSQGRRATTRGKGNSEEALDDMTVVELRKEASEKEIEGRSSMNKDELVDALKQ